MERSPVRGNEAAEGKEDDEDHVDPVDLLVPVGHGPRLVSDMDLGVVAEVGPLLGAKGHIVGCAVIPLLLDRRLLNRTSHVGRLCRRRGVFVDEDSSVVRGVRESEVREM